MGFYHNHHFGDELLNYIRMENITEITVQKTLEDDNTIKDCGTFVLNQTETEEFYKIFSEARIKDIGRRPFSFNTKVRYYIYFNNFEGRTEGTMKFYENEIVIFDYVYGDRPAIHKRYSIISSSLKNFFERIFIKN